jgi:hypothetical protein
MSANRVHAKSIQHGLTYIVKRAGKIQAILGLAMGWDVLSLSICKHSETGHGQDMGSEPIAIKCGERFARLDVEDVTQNSVDLFAN